MTPALSGDRRLSTRKIILVLGALTAFGPFATDMYLSGFGAIADSLGTDIGKVQLSLSAFFFGLCAGQLFYGPLIDAYGRRGPLLAGIALFTVASIAAALAPSIGAFIGVRFVQAIGGCAGMVVSRTLIHDLFSERDASRAFSMMMLVQSAGPIVAPILGGYLLVAGTWRSIFWFLVILGVVCLAAAWRVIPETLAPEKRTSPGLRTTLKAFGALLCTPRFLVPTLALAVALSEVFAFITGSPFVYMKLHGVSQQAFGYLFGMNALSLIFSSQLNRFLLKRAEPRTIFAWALVANLAATSALIALAGSESLLALVIPMLLSIACLPLIGANGVVMAMSASGGRAGSASSIIGVMQFGLASLVSALVGLLHNDTAYPMCGLMFLASLSATALFYCARGQMRPVRAAA